MLSAAAHSLSANDPTPSTAWAYRRQARRLRWQYRDNPRQLLRSLTQLAQKADSVRLPTDKPSAVRPFRSATGLVSLGTLVEKPVSRHGNPTLKVQARPWSGETIEAARPAKAAGPDPETIAKATDTSSAIVDEFATLVAAELQHGILRQSQRTALVKQASQFGIGAFEANLLIATVEHRVRMGTMKLQPLNAKSVIQPRTSSAHSWMLAASILLIEAAILLRCLF